MYIPSVRQVNGSTPQLSTTKTGPRPGEVLQEVAIQPVLQGVDLQVVATLQDLVDLADLVGPVDPLEVEVLDCPHPLQLTRSSPTNIPVATPSIPQFLLLFLPPLRNYHSFPTAQLVKNTVSLPTPLKL
jgi:hypothetical protein